MRSVALVVAFAVTMLALPGSARADRAQFRMAYIDTGGAVCVADVSTLAAGCVLPQAPNADTIHVAWSPDGTMLAVERQHYSGPGDLVVVSASGAPTLPGGHASPWVIANDPAIHGAPMWSKESADVAVFAGDRIAISSLSGTQRSVDVPAFDGSADFEDGQGWSPDGTRFATARGTAAGATLGLVDAQSGAWTALKSFASNANGAGQFNGITWSADGVRLLFTYAPPTTHPGSAGTESQDWTINADGSGARMLYDSPRDDGPVMEARFSSDGSEIAFDGYDPDGHINIFLMSPDGSNVRQLTHSAHAFRPRWLPGADTNILYDDSAASTLMIIQTGRLGGTIDPPRALGELFAAHDAEWTSRIGELPPGAVEPELTEPTPLSEPGNPQQSSPPGSLSAGGSVIGPNTGTGPAAAFGWPVRFAAVLFAAAAAATLAGAFVLRRPPHR